MFSCRNYFPIGASPIDSNRTGINLSSDCFDVYLCAPCNNILQTIWSVDAFRKSSLGSIIQQLVRNSCKKKIFFMIEREIVVLFSNLVWCLSTSSSCISLTRFIESIDTTASHGYPSCVDTVNSNNNDCSCRFEERSESSRWTNERSRWKETRLKQQHHSLVSFWFFSIDCLFSSTMQRGKAILSFFFWLFM